MMNSLLIYALIALAVLIVMSIPSTFLVVAALMQSARLSRAEESSRYPLHGRS